MRNVFELEDEELEDCVDGSTNIDMLREILEKDGVVIDGWVEPDDFANWFAYGLEGYIDAEEGTDEWQEAYDNNYEWGMSIADNINDYLESEEDDHED